MSVTGTLPSLRTADQVRPERSLRPAMPAGRPLLRCSNVRKSYGKSLALAGLNFELRRGESLGLLGPNGAGKTTTMHLLAGVLRPDAGEVRMEPDVPGGPQPSIGIAPQSLALYERLTARENLAFFGSLHGLTGSDLRGRVDAALDLVGLHSRAGDRVQQFSGGMKRRLNVACATIHDPAILLLDEPTVGVDPQSREKIFSTLTVLRARGVSVLYSTHYMEEAERLCDRVAIVDRGIVLAVDTVADLVARHGGNPTLELEIDGATPLPEPFGNRLRNGSVRFEHPKPMEVVLGLHARGITIKSVSIRRPTLESVFMALTGRALRDQ